MKHLAFLCIATVLALSNNRSCINPPPARRLVPNDYAYNAIQFNAAHIPEAWYLMQGKWRAQGAPLPWMVVIDDGFFPTSETNIRYDGFPGYPDGSGEFPQGTAWGDIPPPGYAPSYGFHGTAVMSLLASSVNNGHGIAGLVGIWRGQEDDQMGFPEYYPIRIGTDPILPFHIQHLKRAFTEDVLAHPQIGVVNISRSIIDISEPPGSELEQLFNQAYREQILIVTGAGNKKEDRPADIWLEQFKNVIIVGGLNANGSDLWIEDDGISGTATGAAVDIYAPAQDLRMLIKDTDIRTESGTSYATPFVTAVVVMMQNLDTPILRHPEVIKDIIVKTGDPVTVGNPAYTIPRLNAYRALSCATNLMTGDIPGTPNENGMIPIVGEFWTCKTPDSLSFYGELRW